MKVLFVCTTGGSGRRQFGGAERILTEIIPAHARTNVDVIAATSDDEVGASLRESGVPWVNLSAASRVDLSYARALRHLVDEVKPDVVCAHLLSAAMHSRAALTTASRRTPLVVTMHTSLWQFRDTAPSLKRKASIQSNITLDLVMRRLRPHASVAVSQFEAEELRNRGHVKNVHLIPNPLPATWPAPTPARMPDPSRRLLVGYLGRVEPEKGVDLMPEVASLMPDTDFAIAGSGVLALDPRPNLECVGRVNAADFLRQLDCLVVPSRVEAFGLSALEAMSLGVPVVHSGAGGLAEVTRHAAGTLAFQSDLVPASIAAAIRQAVGATSPEQRHMVADWYAKEYAFDRCVERWQSLYRSLLTRNAT
ncbi:glycosyltransferase family 4 protein [Micromonospora inositola]|uniref:Glycosyltransferase involved in cell wall bisynthesis n=1 Tax=Micromonospora inositola TaxID=47865 RepID=A0A1C5H048_9ACTN|nr:glycosyltransferase family 4 protein [Micromonospora inositola]SCG38781.1 Glycosyltransferase involved in cell wall bisynthesis [Micromonospora inositola]